MKRMIIVLLAMGIFLVCQSRAEAVDVRLSGVWDIGVGWAGHQEFRSSRRGHGHNDPFGAAQRFRPRFEFIADETLRGVLEFEIGTQTWGLSDDESRGGGLEADGVATKLRRGYIDWTPGGELSLRMGIQGVALPSAAFGNPILDSNLAGVVANYRLADEVSLTAFWLRPFDQGWGHEPKNRLDEMDMFGLTLPIGFEDFTFTPWVVYARAGNASGYWEYRAEDDDHPLFDNGDLQGSTNFLWAGFALEQAFWERFALKLDLMYGQNRGGEAPQFRGFLAAGLLEYESEKWWGNPGLIGWYGSGDRSRDFDRSQHGRYGRMPIISVSEAGFAPTSYGFAGTIGCLQDSAISGSGVGTWGIGVQLDEMTFVDSLSHVIRAAYINGTNHEDMVRRGGANRFGEPYNIMGDTVYMTRKDRAVEIDFVTAWKAHENLSVYLETSYIFMDLDSGVWGGRNASTENAWKCQLLFQFTY